MAPPTTTPSWTEIVDKAEIAVALCDTRLTDELVACAKESRFLTKVIGFDGTANHDAELDRDRRQGRDRGRAVRHPVDGRAGGLREGESISHQGHRFRWHRQPRRRAGPRSSTRPRSRSRCATPG